jgi:hypothetical protein
MAWPAGATNDIVWTAGATNVMVARDIISLLIGWHGQLMQPTIW